MSSHQQPQQEQSNVYKNFINSINSTETRINYERIFSYFMAYCKTTSYEDMIAIAPQTLEGLVRDYIIQLRHERRLSPASVSLYLAAIIHFYEMNDVTIKWKKLKKFKAKHYNIIEDKPYTREQIKKLLDAATLRDKCFILLMCSAGLRRGAITHIRLRDITKVDKYGLYRINVYKKEQESYTTFCTPECASYIDQYLDWRQRLGEKLKPNSPLFRIAFDRKFFKTTCIKAGMHPLYSEYVMGHRSGLTKSYFKPTDQELLEGNDKALGYVAAINDLTINEECRLHKKIDEITKKKNEIEIMEIKHNEEIQAMRDQMSQIMSMIQHNPMLAHIKPEALKTKMIE